ncbi:helix-turn-helix domain-containing protein [Arthrobacter sp. A2-55]|uniref:helix-turn-helix domain-containing protein n=1 Tax=Arthrobacter sp. A2-55 TaxID=2897337 RepID=UPI0021CDCD72|nr:helix-turn-helix domain-containing protein [Arthrobacter sp. A2-55]MCU6479899.1 helix-turn-helix domain-containing protein [Arthrobacter sp. A2-55]
MRSGSVPHREGLARLTPSYGLNLKPSRGQQFAIRGIDFGETGIFSLAITAGSSHVMGQPDGHDSVILAYVQNGRLDLMEDYTEQELVARPGSAWMYSRSTNFQMDIAEDAVLVSITLPLQVLRDFGITESPTLHELNSVATMLPPTLGFIQQALEQDGDIPSVAAYFMEKLLHEMVGGILLENLGAVVSGSGRKSIFDQAMAYIAATAGNRELTPASLAHELSVSLRQLQRDFKRHHLAIAEVIRSHRIDLALRLLKDPKLEVLSLEKIAEHAGFSSLVQMRRTLQEAQLGHPSELRSRSRATRREVEALS